jgi:hypothetical protein
MMKRPWSRAVRYAVAATIAAGGVLAAAVLLAVLPYGGELGRRITAGRPFPVTVPEAGVLEPGVAVGRGPHARRGRAALARGGAADGRAGR